MKHVCQGKCKEDGTCKGIARKVKVTNPEKTVNWGTFYYCQRAIIDTRDEGFIVEIIQNKISAADYLSGKF